MKILLHDLDVHLLVTSLVYWQNNTLISIKRDESHKFNALVASAQINDKKCLNFLQFACFATNQPWNGQLACKRFIQATDLSCGFVSSTCINAQTATKSSPSFGIA